MTIRELLAASRPFSWVNTALPFLAAAYGAAGRLDPVVILGVAYFLFPYNLLLYGVNDLHDHESDVRNPRKGSIEGGLVEPTHGRPLWSAIAFANVPLLALLAWLGGPAVAAALGVTALVAWAYSAPPMRTKERPFLDSLTSALHFVLPALCGFLVAGMPLDGVPWPLVVAFLGWGIASHALGAIQDIAYDRLAGIGSIATALGPRPTAAVSLVGYGAAVAIVAAAGPAGVAGGACLSLYLVLPLMILARPDEWQARRAWRGFLGINLLVGFVLTQLLLRLWGVTTFTGSELLVGLGVGAAGLVLLLVATNARFVRPPVPVTASGAEPAVSVVIPCRNEAERLPACLAALRASTGVRLHLLVVDDGSTDATATVARPALGDTGAVLGAPPVPAGWVGKSWAAWTGARAATTPWLVFLDADTTVAPGAIAALVAVADRQRADLVSGVTRYDLRSRAERALMPGFPMLLFGFLPLALLARTAGRPAALAFAYGPLILVRRTAYLAVGGHEAVAASRREDVDLARRFAGAGRRVAIVRATELAATRHYADVGAIARAWRRVLPAYAGDPVAIGGATLAGFALAWALPPLLPLVGLATGDPVLLGGGATALALMLAARVILARAERMPLSTVAWHPVTVVLTLGAGGAGLVADALGRVPRWHGRRLPSAAAPAPKGTA